MSKHIITLQEFFDQIKAENVQSESSDVRLNFFRLKKLKNILLLKNSVSCGSFSDIKTNTTTVNPLLINDALIKTDLHSLSSDEIKYLVNDKANSILIDHSYPSSIGTLDTKISSLYGDDDILFIDSLSVNPEHRNCGIATELINYAKNSAYNNGFHRISGEVLPLDKYGFCFYGYPTPLPIQLLNYFSYKTGLLRDRAFVDLNMLFKIYKKLGFDVDKVNQQISMDIDETSIPSEKRLPKEFTNFEKNKETIVLYQ